MPSRKLTAHCRRCGTKNHLRACYCNQCGIKQEEGRAPKDADGRAKLYADIAHPINSACREMIQEFVIREYYEELQRAKLPGYVSRYDEYDFDYPDDLPTRPSRVDQRHHDATVSRPHIGTPKSDVAAARRPHFCAELPESESTTRGRSRPNTDGFGAGIFPQE
jgi:stage V sporulation protein G